MPNRRDELCRLLVANIRDHAIFSLDPDGRITTWNAGAAALSGYGEDDIVGEPFGRLQRAAQRERRRAEKLLEAARRDGRAHHEGWYPRADGSWYWARVVVTPLREEPRRLIGFAVVISDLTAHKRREQELHQRFKPFRQLTENLRDIFCWITTPDKQTMLYVSPAYETVWGRSVGSLYDEPLSWIDGIHADDRERVVSALPKQLRGEYDVEYRVARPDGTIRWVRDRAFPVRAADGAVHRLIGVAEDISDRKRAAEATARAAREQAAREAAEWSAHRLEFLADASSILSSSLDYEATLGRVARLAVRDFADYCTVDSVDDGTVHRLATAHRDRSKQKMLEAQIRFSADAENEFLQRVLRGGEPKRVSHVTNAVQEEMATTRRHLELIRELGPTSLLAVPLVARDHVLGLITFVSTRKDRRYSEDDLELAAEVADRAALAVDNARLYRESEAANRAKTEFLAIMSHELRTPLTAIIGYTDLLKAELAGPTTDKQHDQIERIEVSARHLLRLIEEIITYSGVQTGQERVRLRAVDAADLVRTAAEQIEPMARQKGLAFHAHAPENAAVVQTDPDKVDEILMQLLINAVNFTDEGEVELSAEVEEDTVRFEVRDTGMGIARENLEKIFEPFWQVERAMTRRVGGTGLGLSVARRLARLLGGDIKVRSRVDQGSTFTLSLPVRPGEAPPRAARPTDEEPAIL